MRKTAILGILVLFAVLVIPAASANEYYLDPDNSSVAINGASTEVAIWIDATENIRGGKITIGYDSLCGNITSCTRNTTVFLMGSVPVINHAEETLTLTYLHHAAEQPADKYHIANFTIQGNSSMAYCTSDLLFVYQTYMSNDTIDWSIPMDNGTFTQGTPPTEVDLNVTDIEVNPYCNTAGDEIFVNQSNEICATVYNAGPADITGNFDVCFYDDANSVYMGSTTVTDLLAGQNKTVCIYWTPSCGNYPGLSGEHPAIGIPATVNATVDCNGAVTETDEDNNTLLLDTEVSANGYKSKNFDCDTREPLELFNGYDGDQFYGGLAYNVSGRKTYTSTGYPSGFEPGNITTRIHNITLPQCATTVKEARLYITWYDYFYNPVPGCLPNLSVNFNGAATFTTPDAMYTDQKAYDGWDTPKGKYAYNVTSLVSAASDDYSVTIENIDPTNATILLGGILVVVYEGDDCEHIGLWWLEGCDLLSGRTSYCSSTTEATATVGFPGNVPLTIVNSTELITFVDQGMTTGINMLFNGINVRTDAWNESSEAGPVTSGGVDGSRINLETYDVPTPDLLASGNTMGFEDTGTAGMQANLAFLKVTKKSEVVVKIDPTYSTIAGNPGTTTVNITLNGIVDYGSGTIDLKFNENVVEVSDPWWIKAGDSDSVTAHRIGAGHWRISAHSTAGLSSNDVVFANVTFKPTGLPSQCTNLNLTVVKLYDRNYTELQTVTQNGSMCIYESDKPFVTDPTADPAVILNDNGRARKPGTNVTDLSVYITDDTWVDTVTIDLTGINLRPDNATVPMVLKSGTVKAGTWYNVTNADREAGVNLNHNLYVNATDDHGNSYIWQHIKLEVLRRGDVVRNNQVNAFDYYYIARYTVGLEPAPDEFVAGVVPADIHDGVDMADALYIAMHVGIPGYPAP